MLFAGSKCWTLRNLSVALVENCLQVEKVKVDIVPNPSAKNISSNMNLFKPLPTTSASHLILPSIKQSRKKDSKIHIWALFTLWEVNQSSPNKNSLTSYQKNSSSPKMTTKRNLSYLSLLQLSIAVSGKIIRCYFRQRQNLTVFIDVRLLTFIVLGTTLICMDMCRRIVDCCLNVSCNLM